MLLMMGEMRVQRDDMKAFMDGVIEALKGMTITREIIRETVQFQPPEADFEAVVNDLPHLPEGLPQMIAAPSKLELAREWLVNHPEDMTLTGRELESLRTPLGVEISYVTWNKAKKEIR